MAERKPIKVRVFHWTEKEKTYTFMSTWWHQEYAFKDLVRWCNENRVMVPFVYSTKMHEFKDYLVIVNNQSTYSK